MKIRQGFVSNSSSTAYVCNSCGEEVIINDSLATAEMFECEKGHTICEYNCAKGNWEDCEELEKEKEKYIEEYFDSHKKRIEDEAKRYSYYSMRTEEQMKKDLVNEAIGEFRYSVPSRFCPICCFDITNFKDYLPYACYKLDIETGDIPKMMKEEFETYDDFCKKVYGR